MLTRAGSFVVAACLTASACASVTVQVDILDPSDGGSQPPPGILVVDVLVDVTDGDSWAAAGFRAETSNGALFRYAHDPNTGSPVVVNPGTADRFVSFFSKPRGRDANNRFNNGGVALAGRYCGGAVAILDPMEINAAWFAVPPETVGSPTLDGAILRVALDIGSIGAPPENYVLFAGTTAPPGVTPVLRSFCSGAPGIACATFDNPTLVGSNWGVGYVPEPAMLGFLAVLLIPALVRRA